MYSLLLLYVRSIDKYNTEITIVAHFCHNYQPNKQRGACFKTERRGDIYYKVMGTCLTQIERLMKYERLRSQRKGEIPPATLVWHDCTSELNQEHLWRWLSALTALLVSHTRASLSSLFGKANTVMRKMIPPDFAVVWCR